MKKYLIVTSHKEPTGSIILKAERIIFAEDWIFQDDVLCTDELVHNLYGKKFCITSGDKLLYRKEHEYIVTYIRESDVEMKFAGERFIYTFYQLIHLFKTGLFQKS